jgi:hypothetical protein
MTLVERLDARIKQVLKEEFGFDTFSIDVMEDSIEQETIIGVYIAKGVKNKIDKPAKNDNIVNIRNLE